MASQFRLALAVVLETIEAILSGEYFSDRDDYWAQLWTSLTNMPKMLSSTSESTDTTSPSLAFTQVSRDFSSTSLAAPHTLPTPSVIQSTNHESPYTAYVSEPKQANPINFYYQTVNLPPKQRLPGENYQAILITGCLGVLLGCMMIALGFLIMKLIDAIFTLASRRMSPRDTQQPNAQEIARSIADQLQQSPDLKAALERISKLENSERTSKLASSNILEAIRGRILKLEISKPIFKADPQRDARVIEKQKSVSEKDKEQAQPNPVINMQAQSPHSGVSNAQEVAVVSDSTHGKHETQNPSSSAIPKKPNPAPTDPFDYDYVGFPWQEVTISDFSRLYDMVNHIHNEMTWLKIPYEKHDLPDRVSELEEQVVKLEETLAYQNTRLQRLQNMNPPVSCLPMEEPPTIIPSNTSAPSSSPLNDNSASEEVIVENPPVSCPPIEEPPTTIPSDIPTPSSGPPNDSSPPSSPVDERPTTVPLPPSPTPSNDSLFDGPVLRTEPPSEVVEDISMPEAAPPPPPQPQPQEPVQEPFQQADPSGSGPLPGSARRIRAPRLNRRNIPRGQAPVLQTPPPPPQPQPQESVQQPFQQADPSGSGPLPGSTRRIRAPRLNRHNIPRGQAPVLQAPPPPPQEHVQEPVQQPDPSLDAEINVMTQHRQGYWQTVELQQQGLQVVQRGFQQASDAQQANQAAAAAEIQRAQQELYCGGSSSSQPAPEPSGGHVSTVLTRPGCNLPNCWREEHHEHEDEDEWADSPQGMWQCAFCDQVNDHDHPEEAQPGWYWECLVVDACAIKTKHDHTEEEVAVATGPAQGQEEEMEEGGSEDEMDEGGEEEEEEEEDEEEAVDGSYDTRGAIVQLAPLGEEQQVSAEEEAAFREEARLAKGGFA